MAFLNFDNFFNPIIPMSAQIKNADSKVMDKVKNIIPGQGGNTSDEGNSAFNTISNIVGDSGDVFQGINAQGTSVEDPQLEEDIEFDATKDAATSVIGGVTSGAAAGGPLGAVFGGAVGLTKSLFNKKSARKAQAALERRNEIRRNKVQVQKNLEGAIKRNTLPKLEALPFGS